MILSRYRFSLVLFLTGGLLLGISAGCDLLQVSNPNQLTESQIDATSAVPLANGAEAAVTRALGAIYGPYSSATGELIHIGSRSAWGQLDNGIISDPGNEFTDAAYQSVAEATWVTRDYIRRLEKFRKKGSLRKLQPLARTYLYGAIIYTTTADVFDNFVFSDKRDAGKPIGPDNMDKVYDQAITWLDKAISLVKNNNLERPGLATLFAMRARAKYSKALWGKLNPDVNTANPLVNSSGAVSDAREALSHMASGGDFFYELEVTSNTSNLIAGPNVASQITQRREIQFSSRYIKINEDNEFVSVTYEDMISGKVHPYLKSFIRGFRNQKQFADFRVVSQREMYLILAEAALAGNSSLDFSTQINKLRSLDDLPPYNGQVDPLALLKQSREVNLFLQGRRLADHYRFDEPPAEWTDQRDEAGTFFPIPASEIRSNPNV